MARESCISHPVKAPFLVIRDEYVGICRDANALIEDPKDKANEHCAAGLLAIFEHWHNVKLAVVEQAQAQNEVDKLHGKAPTQDVNLWVYKSQSDLKDE